MGCEWVLGGIPPDFPKDAGADAGDDIDEPDSAASPGDYVDASEEDPGEVDAETAPDEFDSGFGGPRLDAEVVDGSASDAGDVQCADSGELSWYPDEDGDGYGEAQGVVVGACAPSSGAWVQRGGDCHDGNATVHPGQRLFFGEPYISVEGIGSFDYDCSGSEDESGTQEALLSCGLLELLACQGSGYAATSRNGIGQNPACGSKIIQTCVTKTIGLLVCDALSADTDDPFLCR